MRAKNTGLAEWRMKLSRFILIGVLAVAAPLALLLKMLSYVDSLSDHGLGLVGAIVVVVAELSSLFVTVVYMVYVYKWLKQFDETTREPKIVSTIRRKTKWLLGVTIAMLLPIISFALRLGRPEGLPFGRLRTILRLLNRNHLFDF